jgi:hypothetical protein
MAEARAKERVAANVIEPTLGPASATFKKLPSRVSPFAECITALLGFRDWVLV